MKPEDMDAWAARSAEHRRRLMEEWLREHDGEPLREVKGVRLFNASEQRIYEGSVTKERPADDWSWTSTYEIDGKMHDAVPDGWVWMGDGDQVIGCAKCGTLFLLSAFKSQRKNPQRYCSPWCAYVAKLKNPPKVTQKEFEAARRKKKLEEDEKLFRSFGHLLGESSRHSYDMGDPRDSADQSQVFAALEVYFDLFDDPNRKLHAIHNLVRWLKKLANEQQVRVARDADG